MRQHDGAHALFVFVVAARDDRDRDAASRADALAQSIHPTVGGDNQFNLFIRKPFARDEIRAVVTHARAIAYEASEACECCADMSRAADDQTRLRLYALEEDAPFHSWRKLF